MTNLKLALLCIFTSFGIQAQGIIGAWENDTTSESGDQLKTVITFVDGYLASTTFNASTGKFIATHGGSWTLEGEVMTEKVEFDTTNSDRVGTEISYKLAISDNEIDILDTHLKFDRIDAGGPGKLQGAWLMSGRIIDGQAQVRNKDSPRKTMKILSGSRFQWIAYNTETKQFMGTGGVTYTTINGDYTERIEFFSKDDSRVGLDLKFKYELVDGQWHHKGLSSKGDPINEVWRLRD